MMMGAQIAVAEQTARILGPTRLRGARVRATDIRSGAALVLAALAAEGDTVVNRLYHLDRGYERLEEKLSGVGATIERRSSG